MMKFIRIPGLDPAVSALIIINLAAAVILWCDMLMGVCGLPSGWSSYIFALPADPVAFLHRPWTLFTYMFAQAQPLQLIFNMLWLYWFGRMLMDTDSEKTLIILYIGGGIFAGICYILANLAGISSIGRLMGSSASILSIMVYTAIRQPNRPVPLFILGEIRLKWIAIATICITLIGAAGIASHIAHLSGAAFPLLLLLRKKLHIVKSSNPSHANIKRKVPKVLSRSGPIISPLKRKNLDPSKPLSKKEAEIELDRLLDKIRISGFDSLSDKEKKLLEHLSKQL